MVQKMRIGLWVLQQLMSQLRTDSTACCCCKGFAFMLLLPTPTSTCQPRPEFPRCRLLCTQPVATALFANSPFKEGKPTGYLSWRSHVWTDTDPDRCAAAGLASGAGLAGVAAAALVARAAACYVWCSEPGIQEGLTRVRAVQLTPLPGLTALLLSTDRTAPVH